MYVRRARSELDGLMLFVAAQVGEVEVVRALVGADADLNQAKKDGATPLHVSHTLTRARYLRWKIFRTLTRGERGFLVCAAVDLGGDCCVQNPS